MPAFKIRANTKLIAANASYVIVCIYKKKLNNSSYTENKFINNMYDL